MKLAAGPLIYFPDLNVFPDQAGIIHYCYCFRRPKSFPVIDIALFDFVNENMTIQIHIPHAQSLQQALEIGGCWSTPEEAESWGIDLEDGDQDLLSLLNQ